MSEQLLVRLTKQNRFREMYSPMGRKQQYTSAFDKTCLLRNDLLPTEDNFCRKRSCTIVSLCFVASMRTFPYICSLLFAGYSLGRRGCRISPTLNIAEALGQLISSATAGAMDLLLNHKRHSIRPTTSYASSITSLLSPRSEHE